LSIEPSLMALVSATFQLKGFNEPVNSHQPVNAREKNHQSSTLGPHLTFSCPA
ncbi:hypothetical protein NDU88_004192, partial [Pleurodeles waltl]